MRSFLFLWASAIVYILGDIVQSLLRMSPVSQFFLPVLFIGLIPIWIYGLEYLKTTFDIEYRFPSIPRSVIVLGLSLLISWYFSLSFPLALIVLVMFASIFGLMNIWILLLTALILLTVVPISFLMEKRDIAELSMMYSYYALALGFIGNMFADPTTRITGRYHWMEYSPMEWKAYLRELEGIFRWYLRIISSLFPLTLIYIYFEKVTWPIFLTGDVPMFLVLFLYLSFLIVPLQGDPRKPLSLKI